MSQKIPSTVIVFLAASNLAIAEEPYNWSGAYVGANIGVIWNNSHFDANHINFPS